MALLNIVFPTCPSQTSQLTSLRTRNPFVVPTKLLKVSLSRNNKAPSIKCRSDAGATGDKLSIAHHPAHIKRHNFPKDFIFGTSSSAYQVEGAANEGGKGPSIWDTFTHNHPEKIADWSNGDIAVDAYNRYSEDIKIMKDAGIDAYRFSISWSRILPEGSLAGGINQEGIDHYHRLIDEIIAQGMKPFVTLFHWDVPQGLEDKYGGFRNAQIADDFKDYCEICFREFGHKVKYWTTLNEPYMFSMRGYDQGAYPPGRCSPSQGTCEAGDSATEPYIVSHNLLLAHGKAARLYKEYFQAEQKGEIGITLNCQWSIPLNSDNFNDQAAVFRYLDFSFGWFMDPLVNGDYPFIMRGLVGDRLPFFTEEESEMIKGSYDFIGLNYYTTRYAYTRPILPNEVPISSTLDSYVELSAKKDGSPIGPVHDSIWVYSYPQGLKELLIYTKKKYDNPIIYVTENGTCEGRNDKISYKTALHDPARIQYLQEHLAMIRAAMSAGVKVKGYFVWSLLDSFEWNFGYNIRFGLTFVDYIDNLKRHPKTSLKWLTQFLK